MRVLAIVGKYPPVHNAGAEVMLQAMLRDLVERGHEASVTYPGAKDRLVDGVSIVGARFPSSLVGASDVVISHLDVVDRAVRVAGGRPVVQILHNDRQPIHRRAALVVANSEWIAASYGRWSGEMVTVRPPVRVADYECGFDAEGFRAKATLLNLCRAKGGRLFWELAAQMPERRFLGVRGGYGDQIVPKRLPANVQVFAHTPHVVAEVYSRTRVLLVPSEHESWGRVAIEAACSGIPVVAHPTPGLVEALGHAGIFCDRKRPAEWAEAIQALDDPDTYRQASDLARARAVELDAITRADLAAFEERLVALVSDWSAMSGTGGP